LSSSVNGKVNSVRKQKERYNIHHLSFYCQTFIAPLWLFSAWYKNSTQIHSTWLQDVLFSLQKYVP